MMRTSLGSMAPSCPSPLDAGRNDGPLRRSAVSESPEVEATTVEATTVEATAVEPARVPTEVARSTRVAADVPAIGSVHPVSA